MSPEKQDIEVLSQLIDSENGHYRLRIGQRVHYITLASGVFDEDTMCRPYLLIPQLLPILPSGAWTTMKITRDTSGSPVGTILTDPLPEVKTLWHTRRVDVLSLRRTRRFRSGVHEVQWPLEDSLDAPSGVAIAKIACFSWDIARIERETQAYLALERYQEPPPIAPRFLGHITENGRPIGLLLEKVDGEPASSADLADCEAIVGRLHNAIGLVHGDLNRHNFVMDRRPGGGIRLVDFEHASVFQEDTARLELLSLPAELAEETGRGGTIQINK